MKFMEKVWDNLGLFESDGKKEELVGPEQPRVKKASSTGINNVISLPSLGQNNTHGGAAMTQQIKVMVVEPTSFDDTQHVADYLKTKKPVVINFENTDAEVTRRMIDFISGTTYALDGTIQKVGHNIFLCAPNNVDVSYGEKEASEKGFFFWSKKGINKYAFK